MKSGCMRTAFARRSSESRLRGLSRFSARQGGQSHFRGGYVFSMPVASRAAKTGTVPNRKHGTVSSGALPVAASHFFQFEDDGPVAVGTAGDKDVLPASGHAIHQFLDVSPSPTAETFRHLPRTLFGGDELLPQLEVFAFGPAFGSAANCSTNSLWKCFLRTVIRTWCFWIARLFGMGVPVVLGSNPSRKGEYTEVTQAKQGMAITPARAERCRSSTASFGEESPWERGPCRASSCRSTQGPPQASDGPR